MKNVQKYENLRKLLSSSARKQENVYYFMRAKQEKNFSFKKFPVHSNF